MALNANVYDILVFLCTVSECNKLNLNQTILKCSAHSLQLVLTKSERNSANNISLKIRDAMLLALHALHKNTQSNLNG